MLPLAFAAAPPSLPRGPAARTGGSRTGSANRRDGGGSVDHYPGRVAGSPYPQGAGPAPGGEFRTRQWQRPAAEGPWPALPDDAGAARATNPAATGTGRATGDGAAHPDPWPLLPAEPAWVPERTTPWSDTARLDREQAGD
ncbi:hypothetical protein [Micromonospora tulbaghiae]|uniref:hypothetical protein n=1 Tax=Micromonospora tulbaghiae TaxID=479978 RepID=UPI0034382E96